jgi:SAM-dependent methyltransferase
MSPQPKPRVLPALIAAAAFALALGQAAAQRPQLDVPFVPTPPEVVSRMLDFVNITKDDFVMDLGSGDGRIAIAAAQRGARAALGIDIDPDRVAEARANAQKAGVADRVKFEQGDLFKAKISDANVITMYLLTSVNLKLRPRLLDELKPGTRLVSHQFDMGDWEADKHEKLGYRDIYFWIVPAKVEGRWEVTDGNSKFQIDLKQKYQRIEGTASGGHTGPLSGARLEGDMISFSAGGKQYSGKVVGDRIEGQGWSAKKTS